MPAPSFIWPTKLLKAIASYQKFGSKSGRHTGLDFGRKGNTVVAAAAGKVRKVTDMLAGGWAVWITHAGSYETRYLHLNQKSISVSKGDKVTQGQQIASVGYTGLDRAYGAKAPLAAHLHFEILLLGKYQDPETLLPAQSYGSAAAPSGLSLVDKAKAQGLKGPNDEWAWYWVEDNGSPRYTKAGVPADAPTPGSNAVWPLKKKRPLSVYRFVPGKGPNGGRCIGYRRGNGARAHAGIDLCARYKDIVVAVEDGTIIGFYHFYAGTFALLINHGSYIINYGEVDRSSLDKFGLKTPKFKDGFKNGRGITAVLSDVSKYGAKYPWLAAVGSSVKAGDNIAIVGKMEKSSMLHFEIYSSGDTTQSWPGFPDQAAPSRLLNPTNFLLVLSGRKKEAQPSAKEQSIAEACRV